ncbi:MAG: hypothetical protein BWY36_00615 [Candidatus Diapherotrites archaeon ADurb.Bin253]|nr:MAG: hypothetical protein BWY36_00615 [Candidatus Diapherotrites archaeon ADurb.Bin253]
MDLKFICKNCGEVVSEKEMLKNDFVCKKCGKREGYLSEPVFFKN